MLLLLGDGHAGRLLRRLPHALPVRPVELVLAGVGGGLLLIVRLPRVERGEVRIIRVDGAGNV